MLNRKFLFTIAVIISIMGCKSKINQMVNHQREGRWVTIDTLDSIYIVRGKYHKNTEIGTWKHIYNGRIVKKENYRNGVSKATFYHPNGKIMKRGYTKLESTAYEDHWYYFGKWSFYDSKGKLDSVKIYNKENF
jgi:antitoxin component YwqK of YwqJK toxin-antitoxin module